MSDKANLSTALEGLRQAEKQLQWVKSAQDIIKAAQEAEARRDAAQVEHDKVKAEHEALKDRHAKLKDKVSELHAKEEEAAKKAFVVEQHLSKILDEEKAKILEANEIAKGIHDRYVDTLNVTLNQAQDEHDAHVAKLKESIALLEEKKSAVENDITELSKKWS